MAHGAAGDCSLGRWRALSLAVAGFPRKRREGADAGPPGSDRRVLVTDSPPSVAGLPVYLAKKGGPC